MSQVEWVYVDGNILAKDNLNTRKECVLEQIIPDIEVKSNIIELINGEDKILKDVLWLLFTGR